MYKVFLYCFGVYLLLIVFLCGLVFSIHALSRETSPEVVAVFASEEAPIIEKEHVLEEQISKPILFVGDIMLGRNVEREMDAHDVSYPFNLIDAFLASYPYVVGNFEAVVPRTHIPTPSMTFQFSVATTAVGSLREHGFTHVTLANNHAYDYGTVGYENTRTVLQEKGFSVGGSPDQVTNEDVLFIDAEGLRVALVPIYAVFANPDIPSVRKVFAYAASSSDMQIALIHWGDEYTSRNNAKQSRIARQVVDAGADAVIGHHPHVIQNIELYHGVPIFYSLGNFIFDQYWNEEVKTGLAVSLGRKGGAIQYSVFPLFSERSNPTVLEGIEKEKILTSLAEKSDATLEESIKNGVIEVSYAFLASRR